MRYSVYMDDELIYSTAFNDPDSMINNPVVSLKIGKSGSFSFDIFPNHFAYDKIKEMVSVVLIYQDSELIFRGRVSGVSKNFYNQKEVYCEGDMSFLVDSYQKKGIFKESPADAFRRLISDHNSQTESFKHFTVGNITVKNVSDVNEYEVNSYRNTMESVEDLISEYGGYVRTRRLNDVIYIDWLKDYGTETNQPIEFGLNLLDLSDEFESDDLFTVLVPFGNDGLSVSSVNNGREQIEIQEGINKYGKIYKVEEFSDSENPEDLLNKANQYIEDHFVLYPKELTINAIDLTLIGVDVNKILLGTKALIKSNPHKINNKYTCTEIEYYLQSPNNNVYTFGDPKQDLIKSDKTFTGQYTNQTGNVNDAIAGNSAGVSSNRSKLDDYIRVTDDTLLLHAENIELNARAIRLNSEEIKLRATKDEMEAELKIVYDEISARVTNEDFEAYVTIAADQIRSKVSSEDFSTYVTQTDKELTLKANQTTVDALTNRVTNAESSIKVNADSIETKVSKNGVISSINQTAESVKIQASKIELSGYVTASQLSAELANFQLTMNQNIVTNNLSVNAHAYLPSYVTISSHALSLDSMDVVTSVGRKRRYAMGPSGTTIEIYECSSVHKESINFVSWS